MFGRKKNNHLHHMVSRLQREVSHLQTQKQSMIRIMAKYGEGGAVEFKCRSSYAEEAITIKVGIIDAILVEHNEIHYRIHCDEGDLDIPESDIVRKIKPKKEK